MKSRPRSDEAGARRITLVLGCLALSAWACTGDEPAGPSTNPRVAAASASVAYTVRDLGTLGGPSSRASDINKAGIVVGLSTTASGATHAFRWQTGVMTDLGTLSGGGASAATAINRAGVIVGWSENRFGGTRAMQWSGDSKRSLGTLGGRHSRAEDINDSGWIVGWSQTQSGETHAFLWRNGRMLDLGTLGGSLSIATGINNAGVVVGYSTKTGGGVAKQFAFRWKDGVMRALPSLPGTESGNYARASAIMGGRIVGEGAPDEADGDFSHVLIWDSGVMTDLGRLGGDYARAEDVNADGVVVGLIDYHPPDCDVMDAFVWSDGELAVLPVLGGENSFAGAAAINRSGTIVGFSETDIGSSDCELGQVHAALWTAN